MSAPAPTYDLTLMLDTSAPDDQRERVLADVERMIGAGGTITNRQDWGVRQTAYEIRHQADAEYHLIQFEAGRDVLETLNRTLRITDGVVRFRVIKLAPGTPAPPETRPEPRPTGVTDSPGPPEAPAPEAAVEAPADTSDAPDAPEPAEPTEAPSAA